MRAYLGEEKGNQSGSMGRKGWFTEKEGGIEGEEEAQANRTSLGEGGESMSR